MLNRLKYKKIKCAITLYLFDLDGDFDSKEDLLLYLAAIRQTKELLSTGKVETTVYRLLR